MNAKDLPPTASPVAKRPVMPICGDDYPLSDKQRHLMALARQLAAGPTFAHGITKTQLNQEWNMGLEQAIEAEAQAQLRVALSPLRALLQEQNFINGTKPAWADYCVFGSFMWLRNVSPKKLLMEDDPVFAWRERMLDLYGGLARKSKRAAT